MTRFGRESLEKASAGRKAAGRARRTAAVKSSVSGRMAAESGPDDGGAEEDEGEHERHFRGCFAVFEEAVAEFDVERGDGEAGGEGGEKAASMYRFGGSEGEECDAQGVEGFVVAADADSAANQIKGRDSDESNGDACAGPRSRRLMASRPHCGAPSPGATRDAAIRTMGRRTTSFRPLSRRRAWRTPSLRFGSPDESAEQDRSVEARAAPRMAATGGENPSRPRPRGPTSAGRQQGAGADDQEGEESAAPTSARSRESESVKRTRARLRVATTRRTGESMPTLSRPRPDGPIRAPRRRKTAVWGEAAAPMRPKGALK